MNANAGNNAEANAEANAETNVEVRIRENEDTNPLPVSKEPLAPPAEKPIFEVVTSRNFTDWLESQNVSLALSTYQVGKILFFGIKPDKKLWIFNRNIGRCLGMVWDGKRKIYVTSDSSIYSFVNAHLPGQRDSSGVDAHFVPQNSCITGDLDIHDLGVNSEGSLIFVNTLFNCLAQMDFDYSFKPIWMPPFISRLASEDRCHLNGLAMRDGKPRYVTAVSETDTFDGWRDNRTDGGIVMDISENRVIARGFSMPHSPRWHNGAIYLHDSGHGTIKRVDVETGKSEDIAFCPGYLRGLDFIGDYALVGLSKPRELRTFSGLPLDDALKERKVEPRCGLYIIDLRTGDIVHWLRMEGVVSEIYDVIALNGLRMPSALSPLGTDIKRHITINEG